MTNVIRKGLHFADVSRCNRPDKRRLPKHAPARRAEDWVLAWMTPLMPAPAFWYYKRKRDAVAAAKRIMGGRDPVRR